MEYHRRAKRNGGTGLFDGCCTGVTLGLRGCSLKNYVFKIVVEDDEHEDGRPTFRAYCPALESIGAATWGDTREEAVKNISEVLHMIVEELAEEGKEIPPDALIASTESSAVLVSA